VRWELLGLLMTVGQVLKVGQVAVERGRYYSVPFVEFSSKRPTAGSGYVYRESFGR